MADKMGDLIVGLELFCIYYENIGKERNPFSLLKFFWFLKFFIKPSILFQFKKKNKTVPFLSLLFPLEGRVVEGEKEGDSGGD